jgi:hypothetical protein
MLEPRSVLYGFELTAHGSSTPPTRPNETIFALRSNAPRHIPTASVTHHLSTNQARILQKLEGKIHVYEEIRKEELVRSTVVPQHGSSKRTSWRKRLVHQTLLIIRDHRLQSFDHVQKSEAERSGANENTV